MNSIGPEAFFTVPWSQPVAVAAPDPAPAPDCDPVPPDQIGAIVAQASEREALDRGIPPIPETRNFVTGILGRSGAR